MAPMCWFCFANSSPSLARRGFLLAAGALAASPVLAQVDVGTASWLRNLVPAAQVEAAATHEYAKLLGQVRAKGVLAPESDPRWQRLRAISARLIRAYSA